MRGAVILLLAAAIAISSLAAAAASGGTIYVFPDGSAQLVVTVTDRTEATGYYSVKLSNDSAILQYEIDFARLAYNVTRYEASARLEWKGDGYTLTYRLRIIDGPSNYFLLEVQEARASTENGELMLSEKVTLEAAGEGKALFLLLAPGEGRGENYEVRIIENRTGEQDETWRLVYEAWWRGPPDKAGDSPLIVAEELGDTLKAWLGHGLVAEEAWYETSIANSSGYSRGYARASGDLEALVSNMDVTGVLGLVKSLLKWGVDQDLSLYYERITLPLNYHRSLSLLIVGDVEGRLVLPTLYGMKLEGRNVTLVLPRVDYGDRTLDILKRVAMDRFGAETISTAEADEPPKILPEPSSGGLREGSLLLLAGIVVVVAVAAAGLVLLARRR